MTILFIGDLNEYGRCYQRYMALKDMGHKVIGVSYMPIGYHPGITNDLVGFEIGAIKKVFNKLGYPLDSLKINEKVLGLAKYFAFDIVWIEKALMLRHRTLNKLREDKPEIKIIFCSEDDMVVRYNQSKYFLKYLSICDTVFTTKSYNCNPEELHFLGAKKVVLVDNAYCKYMHGPTELSNDDEEYFSAGVGFIGTFELDRAKKMLYLAGNGIKIRVWGNGWHKWVNKHRNLRIENKPVYGKDYVKAISATKINLCFLRKANRDLQTSRSIEVPACGGFMLAERTNEHQKLFEEGKEAEYFDIDNPKELLEKVKYYLQDEHKRKRIAEAGRQRCISSGYSHHDRLNFMLAKIEDE
ncbi:MAG: hypothetical protein A2X55_04980 [Nitrospirae bacterium GWB2_47_37]|nr:MAG: hypothetical protein A2X55_04980 [Nitrospirae bacterium GWB2_47_37]